MKLSTKRIIALLGIYLLYAFVSVFTKYAALQEPCSLNYFLGLLGAFCVMGIYALLWQQVLKKTPLTDAYMLKGSSLIFLMILSASLFGEVVTMSNIIGAVIIFVGIVIYSKS